MQTTSTPTATLAATPPTVLQQNCRNILAQRERERARDI